jgi:hypothetical protein
MPVSFFQISLSVQAKSGGYADLVPPKVLQRMNYHFLILKDGGEEGIIQLEESEEVLEEVGKNENCKKLTEEQMKDLQASYPIPKLKKKYRMRTQEADQSRTTVLPFEVDEQGNKIVDTFQTVRSGFYLIDVPVLA